MTDGDTMPAGDAVALDAAPRAMMQQLVRMGQRWAETGVLPAFDTLPPEYRPNPAHLEVRPDDYGPANAVANGYGDGLARRYVATAGLPINAAGGRRIGAIRMIATRNTALQALAQPGRFRLWKENASRALRDAVDRAENQLSNWHTLAVKINDHRLVGRDLPKRDQPKDPVARAIADAIPDGGIARDDLVPLLRERFAEFREVSDFVRATDAEHSEVTDAVQLRSALYRRADGTWRPTPEEWVAELIAAGEKHRVDAITLFDEAIWYLVDEESNEERDALQAELDAERARREAAEREGESARRERDAAVERMRSIESGLPDRVIVPRQLVDSGYDLAYFARLNKEIAQGNLFTSENNTLDLIRAQAQAVVATSQLTSLNALEIRAMLGVLRLFTRHSNAESFTSEDVLAPISIVYQATNTPKRGSQHRALFDALRKLANREINVALKLKDGDKTVVVGERAPIFHMNPIWSASTDKRRALSSEDADAIAQLWATEGSRAAKSGEVPEWTGPLPDQIIFRLPPIMQKVFGSLVLDAETLDRLETGAKKVRGASGAHAGFTSLDWRLFMEITQTVQRGQRSDDAERFKSFVNRDVLLADYYGADAIAKARSRGKYKTKMLQPYLNSVQVLKEGGIVAGAELEYRTQKGELRDVFELVPDVVLGTERQLERTRRDPAQAALRLPDPKKRKRASA